MIGSVNDTADVLVIGAGMAGLTAARWLAEHGLRVTIVEARERLGGRVHSIHSDGVIVELGAEFVHGRPPELWDLIEECGAETVERGGSMLREGREGELGEDEEMEDGSLFDPLSGLADLPVDMPFAEWLATSDVPQEEHGALCGYVEGFNAADSKRISARSLGVQQRAEEAVGGDRTWHIRGGYNQLATFLGERVLALGVRIVLGCEVRALTWQEGRVQIETRARSFSAQRCVVTLPLGVLQQVNRDGGVRMNPEPAAVDTARRLAMGDAERFTLVFSEPWWESSVPTDPKALREMSFVFTSQRMPPVWWTAHPEPQAMYTLVGWCGGPRAAQWVGRNTEEIAAAACRTLSDVFGVPESRIRSAFVSAHHHEWTKDPFTLGAYSYVPAGALDAPAAMAAPEAGTLYFAGEHTDITGHWGTVHAAIRSGVRAAQQVFGALTRLG